MSVLISNAMQATIDRPHLDDITADLEDTVQYICNEYQLSGQLVWTIAESLATAKLAEFPHNDN